MRLMGRHLLHKLATSQSGTASAIGALYAELLAANWSSHDEAAAAFPSAIIDGCRVRIPLCEGYCVVVAINYLARAALIEFAGPAGARG